MTNRRPPDDPTVPDAPEESSSAQAAVITKPPPVGAWGQTLVLGAAVPPASDAQHPAPAMRGVFAAPGIAGSTPQASPEGVRRLAPPAATGNTQAPAPPTPALEPLRMASNRPPPTPWQEARGARTGTMMMPTGVAKPGEAPAKPMTPVSAAPARAAAPTARAVPAQTITIGGAVPAYTPAPAPAPQRPAPAPQPPAPEPASPAPVHHVTSARPVAPQVPTVPPKPPQVSAAPPAPKAAAAAAAPKPTSISEPLQLQLAARDLLPEQAGSSRPAVPVNRSPLVVAGIAVALVVAAFLAWLATRSDSPTALPQPEAAVAAPGAVSPQAPTGTSQAELAAPPEAPAAAPPPTKATGALPTEAVAPTEPPAEPKAETAAQPPSRPAAQAAKPNEPKARPAPARPPARARSTPSAAVDPDIERARAALRALQSQPVLKIKPSADDGPVLKLTPERSDDNAPPEPPPAPGE